MIDIPFMKILVLCFKFMRISILLCKQGPDLQLIGNLRIYRRSQNIGFEYFEYDHELVLTFPDSREMLLGLESFELLMFLLHFS